MRVNWLMLAIPLLVAGCSQPSAPVAPPIPVEVTGEDGAPLLYREEKRTLYIPVAGRINVRNTGMSALKGEALNMYDRDGKVWAEGRKSVTIPPGEQEMFEAGGEELILKFK
jgi:hypothetical protein